VSEISTQELRSQSCELFVANGFLGGYRSLMLDYFGPVSVLPIYDRSFSTWLAQLLGHCEYRDLGAGYDWRCLRLTISRRSGLQSAAVKLPYLALLTSKLQ